MEISSTTCAFRARPPRGFFFQPHGSVSPFTFPVAIIEILGLLERKKENSSVEINILIILVYF
tara:strand:- start:599 stop:787 length:189 start_codon:yes stop_codon:yes gene_type:complete